MYILTASIRTVVIDFITKVWCYVAQTFSFYHSQLSKITKLLNLIGQRFNTILGRYHSLEKWKKKLVNNVNNLFCVDFVFAPNPSKML